MTGQAVKLIAVTALAILQFGCSQSGDSSSSGRHPVPKEHPRLLGSADWLKKLAAERPEVWSRVLEAARSGQADRHAKIISLGLAYVIEGDQAQGRQAVDIALEKIGEPIMVGHVPFGSMLADLALAYDLCWPLWSEEERQKFFDYFGRTVDANVRSETHVFHNAWYSYKHWGYGLAGYATYYEYERAPEIVAAIEKEYRERVVPSFALAGDGGGWAEGYYVHYWSYEWMFFCEVARRVEGVDYFAMSPEFLGRRAIAGMFEMYPGIGEYGSHRPIPMGDGGGRIYGGDRDKTLNARRILVNRFRDDPDHQVVHAFNETTPQVGSRSQAYKDFLWRDTSVPKGDLQSFKLSHVSPGPGYVYARSGWDEDATYFFFKCGDRFTAHQHLDNGHFLIYRHEELAADGGQYAGFGDDHDVNYHLRTIAHSTLLVRDPEETWPDIRAFRSQFGGEIDNDGGQHHHFPHHNGAVGDAREWLRDRQLYDIADLTAYEDRGAYLYTAGDCSRAYSPAKLDYFTRQIVYIRPGTFVIFDRVKSTEPAFRKTWLLQAMKTPSGQDGSLVITNGRGRLFVQTLLPADAAVQVVSGENLYNYNGTSHAPAEERGVAPEARIEVSPGGEREVDYFLHVLTATDSEIESVPAAVCQDLDEAVEVQAGGFRLHFSKDKVGGWIDPGTGRQEFATAVAGI